MIGSNAVMKVVGPVGKAVQVNIEVLKEAARVVLAFDRHSKSAPHAGIDTVGCDQITATNQLFFISSVDVYEACCHTVGVYRQVLKCRVVFNSLSEMRFRVVANERLGLALAV